MKKAVCSGYYGFDNFGDDAVLKVLVDCFKDKYDLTVFSSAPTKTSEFYGVKSVYSFDYLNVINSIKSSDAFISGGGSLLQDVTSLKSLLYYLLLIYVAILYKKEIIIFAQGIGPLKSIFSRFLVRHALRHCSKITVRDIESQNTLKKWGIKSTLVSDPVFSLPIKECSDLTGKVGIQLRSFEGVDSKFLKTLASTINKEFSDRDVVIYSFQDSLDLKVCNEFAQLLKTKSVTVKHRLSIDEVIDDYSKLDYLVAMRFHAALIGLRSGVRVLPIAYDKKVVHLAKTAQVDWIYLNEVNKLEQKISKLKSFNSDLVKSSLKSNIFDFAIFDK